MMHENLGVVETTAGLRLKGRLNAPPWWPRKTPVQRENRVTTLYVSYLSVRSNENPH